MTFSAFFYWLLMTSTALAAPQSGPIYRSSVDLKNMKEGYISSDVSKVLSRFEDTLNGVSRPRSYYGSRSNSVSGSENTEASPASASSTLSALLRILDRLQDVDSTQEFTSNSFTRSPLDNSVDSAHRLINKTLPVLENISNEFSSLQPALESISTESGAQKSAEESDEKASNESTMETEAVKTDEVKTEAVKSGNDSVIENMEFINFSNFTIKNLIETTSEKSLASTASSSLDSTSTTGSGANISLETKNAQVSDEKVQTNFSFSAEKVPSNFSVSAEKVLSNFSVSAEKVPSNFTVSAEKVPSNFSVSAENNSVVSTENNGIVLRTDFENILNDSITAENGSDVENRTLVNETAEGFSNGTLVNGTGQQGLRDTADYEGFADPTVDELEERYKAFVPSPELIASITHPPEFMSYDENEEESKPEDEQNPEIIGEPGLVEANRTANASAELTTPNEEGFEMTTLSGEEFFSAKPFLENLVNQTTITEEDLSTVASIAISHSAIATSSALSEDDPNFLFTRNSGNLIQMKTCLFNGVRYVSGQNIDQSDPCHFCVCVDGDVSCYWKNCPPAPDGCADLDFEGVCHRSLYLCPIPVKGQPLPFADNSIKRIHKRQAEIGSTAVNLTCDILGVEYKVGELVGVASDPCMECRCAIDSLYCSPKCCFQPTVDQQILTGSELDQDPSKNARAEDPMWFPVLANPLMHLRSEFENQQN